MKRRKVWNVQESPRIDVNFIQIRKEVAFCIYIVNADAYIFSNLVNDLLHLIPIESDYFISHFITLLGTLLSSTRCSHVSSTDVMLALVARWSVLLK
jgi:hypothetical protein